MKVNKYAKKLQETNPDFKVVLGNEIYLTDTRDMGQRYYHFILLAKDAIGYRALKELSSIAWMNSYYDRRLERVPTLKSELADVMKNYKGHVIATTACIGGELGSSILNLTACEEVQDTVNAQRYHSQIVSFMEMCIDVFGKDDFYVEVAPAASPEQIVANKRLWSIAHAFDVIVEEMVKKFGKDLSNNNVKKDKDIKAINIVAQNKNNNKDKKNLFGCC